MRLKDICGSSNKSRPLPLSGKWLSDDDDDDELIFLIAPFPKIARGGHNCNPVCTQTLVYSGAACDALPGGLHLDQTTSLRGRGVSHFIIFLENEVTFLHCLKY